MTDAQWAFEAAALKRKEEAELNMQVEVVKANARVLRDTLIRVSGADILAPAPEPGAVPAETPPFVPWALFFSNHHLLRNLMEEKQKAETTERVLADDAFEAFSAKLAKGEVGDVDPILLGKLPGGRDVSDLWAEQAAKEALRVLGVKPRPEGAPVVPHLSARPQTGGVAVSFESEEKLFGEGDALPRVASAMGAAPVPLEDNARVGVRLVELEPGLFGGDE